MQGSGWLAERAWWGCESIWRLRNVLHGIFNKGTGGRAPGTEAEEDEMVWGEGVEGRDWPGVHESFNTEAWPGCRELGAESEE